MSDLAYFEYTLVLPDERYLIEVNTRNPYSGQFFQEWEIEVAKECVALAVAGRPTMTRKTQSD